MFRKLLAALALVSLVGCATYRDDLDRSVVHYHANEYDKALALLEVLDGDLDSLSPSEQAQYAYYRGMSYYRLEQRRNARHWLGRSAAREKAHEGSLSAEENKRVDSTLAELNKDRWGGASTDAPEEKPCKVDTDCEGGQFCDVDKCRATAKPIEGAPPAADPPAAAPPAPPATANPPTPAPNPTEP